MHLAISTILLVVIKICSKKAKWQNGKQQGITRNNARKFESMITSLKIPTTYPPLFIIRSPLFFLFLSVVAVEELYEH